MKGTTGASMSSSQTLSRDTASNVARYAFAVLVITSIHHAYGAYVYATPWRYHAVLVAGITAPLMFAALTVVRSGPSGLLRTVALGVFVLATFGVAVGMIGTFEGLYNHVVKILLYFGGLSSDVMMRLFPPPSYEMPNDAFFEVTGVLQVVPAALSAWYLRKMLRRPRAPQRRTLSTDRVLNRRRALTSIHGEALSIPLPDRLVHLQFRRFAGCPLCNMHLQSFVRRHDEIAANGVREVVIFHSAVSELLHHEDHLPFTVVADPEKRLYREFGVEASWRALLDPRVWLPIISTVFNSVREVVRHRRPIPPVKPAGGSLGLPADFLIAADGRVLAYKYGVHADDQWSVDEVLSLVHSTRRSPNVARTDVSAA
jgi:peroxiredoxin